MKKMIALILAALMIVSLTGCIEITVTPVPGNEEAEPAEEPAAEEEPAIVGGWTRAESPEISDDLRALFEDAAEELLGADYLPLALLETQLVAGMNYKFLCRETLVVPDAIPQYALVTVYVDLEGNAEITEVRNSDVEALAALPGEEILDGGWFTGETLDLTDEAKEAFEKVTEELVSIEEADFEPVLLLATQIVAGCNYELLVYQTAFAENPDDYLIVRMYEDLDGNAEVTGFFGFDPAE